MLSSKQDNTKILYSKNITRRLGYWPSLQCQESIKSLCYIRKSSSVHLVSIIVQMPMLWEEKSLDFRPKQANPRKPLKSVLFLPSWLVKIEGNISYEESGKFDGKCIDVLSFTLKARIIN